MKTSGSSGNAGLSRRNVIKSFGLAGLATVAAGPALASRDIQVSGRPGEGYVYADIEALRADRSLKVGDCVRTMGYFAAGDGGAAEYIVSEGKSAAAGTIAISDRLYAGLINVSAVNYRLFGARGDGKSDDGVQIKAAHSYANEHNLPLINPHGEYWLKSTTGIEIKTNVQWGHSVFHIDEKFNDRGTNRFLVMPRESPVDIALNDGLKAKLLEQVKPGVTIIPELAAYKNHLIVVSDVNDRIGVRSGAAYNGTSTKAREEFFFIEEHGRVLGDIAWSFTNLTKVTAYHGSDSYLTIDGGTFYFSGESPGNGITSYVSIGFRVTRSRSVIRNQWVGLEHGRKDDGMAPRNGFYSYSNVYDVLLENVRLIPWEKDRPGTDRDVAAGTYGIGGNYVLNATFRNVTAEGSPVHWGVFGTNLFKNFRVEQCMLNRIDVHFYCYNLYIRDSKVGTNGITVTGGGDLFIENTTCRANNFISFRRDYGAKWDGDIRIRNCRLAPTGRGETSILSMTADNIDYKYPVGYGRTVKVEDVVVDFNTVPDSTASCWLMRLSPFSKADTGGRVFFPSHLEFRNIVVEGREKGTRFMEVVNPSDLKLNRAGSYDGTQISANCRMIFQDIQTDSSVSTHLIFSGSARKEADKFSLYPQILVSRCGDFGAAMNGYVADLLIEHTKLVSFESGATGMQGAINLINCKIQYKSAAASGPLFRLDSSLGTSFINCVVFSPLIDGEMRPELVDELGFIRINKSVRYNHINTRLGNDIISYYKNKSVKFNKSFIAMLKANHELESSE